LWHTSNCSKLEGCKKRHEPKTLSSQQRKRRGRTFVKKLVLCRHHIHTNKPSAQQSRAKDPIKQVASCPSCGSPAHGHPVTKASSRLFLARLGFTAPSVVLRHHASAPSCEGCTRSGGFHHRRLRHPRDKSYGNSFHRAFGSLCVATGSTVRDHLILQAAAPCAPKASPSNQWRCPGGRGTPQFRDRAGYLQDNRKVSKCARVFGPRSFCL
jgi:hypothetical protein